MTFNRNKTDFSQLRKLLQPSSIPYLNEQKFGVTWNECMTYLDNLEQYREDFNKMQRLLFRCLVFLLCLILGVVSALIFYFCSTTHPKVNFLAVMLPLFLCLFLIIYLMNRVKKMKVLPALFQRWAPVPVIREDVEQMLSDYMTKCEIWEHGTEEEKDAVCADYDSGFYGFRDAFFKEIQNPSEDCALGDAQFGMTLDELYQTHTLKGQKRSDNPVLYRTRSMLVGEMVGYSNPFVFFHLRDGKLAEVSIDYLEIIPYLNFMDDETADTECQKVIDYISDNLKLFYGPTCSVGKKYFEIIYSKHERPKVCIRHIDYL